MATLRQPTLALLLLTAAVATPRGAAACDAGVFFGENCTQELADRNDPACVAWPEGGPSSQTPFAS